MVQDSQAPGAGLWWWKAGPPCSLGQSTLLKPVSLLPRALCRGETAEAAQRDQICTEGRQPSKIPAVQPTGSQPHAVLRWVLSLATSFQAPWKSWETEAGSPRLESGFILAQETPPPRPYPAISPGDSRWHPRSQPELLSTTLPALQDVRRCLNALEELGTLQVTSQILQKNTDVVATLKKVWHGALGQSTWKMVVVSKGRAWGHSQPLC